MNSFTLEKFIASQTRLSRRKILDLLVAGKILLNGFPADQLTVTINPSRDRVVVNGESIYLRYDFVYYKYNKPKGVICTMKDPNGRPCIGTVLRGLPDSVVPIGRLDRDTTGLLLLTNDGDFANKVAHPRYHLPKSYRVTLNRNYVLRDIAKLKTGFFLEDGPVRFTAIVPVSKVSLDVTICEGRNRIVRRAFEALGYDVKSLHRFSIGSVTLGPLMPGESRALTKGEFKELSEYKRHD